MSFPCILFFFLIDRKSEAQRKVVTCPRSHRVVTEFVDGRARIGTKELLLSHFLDCPALRGGRKPLFPQETMPPPHLRRQCGEMKEGVSKRSYGAPRAPKGFKH